MMSRFWSDEEHALRVLVDVCVLLQLGGTLAVLLAITWSRT